MKNNHPPNFHNCGKFAISQASPRPKMNDFEDAFWSKLELGIPKNVPFREVIYEYEFILWNFFSSGMSKQGRSDFKDLGWQ